MLNTLIDADMYLALVKDVWWNNAIEYTEE